MKQLFLCWPIIVTVLFFSTACKSETEKSIDRAVILLNSRPDSSLAILKGIRTEDLTGRKLNARYSLYMSAALDKNYIDIASDFIIQPAVVYYSKVGPLRERMLEWYYYGIVLINKQDYTSAVVALEKAAIIAERLKDSHYAGLIFKNIGHAFYQSNNYSSGIEYQNRSISCFAKEDADSTYLNYGYYTQAIYYFANKKYAVSDSLLNMISSSSANTLRHYINSAKARLELFYKDNPLNAISYYQLTPREILYYQDYSYYAMAFDRVGMKDSADYMISRAYSLCNNNGDSAAVDYIKAKMLCNRGLYEDGVHLLDNVIDAQNIRTRVVASESVSAAQRDYFKDLNDLQLEKSRRRTQQSAVSIIILLLSGTIIYLSSISRLKKKDQHLKDMMAQLALNNEKILQLSKDNAKLLSSHFSEMIRQIDTMTKDYFEADTEQQKDLAFKLFKNYIKDLNNNKTFYNTLEKDLNKYCNNIMNKLREQIPVFGEKNLNVIALFFAGLPYDTIAVITGAQSLQSVRMQRSRIRKTIEESNAKDAQFFLEMLEVRSYPKKIR